MCPRQDSNLDLKLRKFPFYPLNYEGFILLEISQKRVKIKLTSVYLGIRMTEAKKEECAEW